MASRRTQATEVTGQYPSKMCQICDRELPLTHFHKNTRSRDGLDGRCVECKADAKRLSTYDLTPLEYKRLLFLQNYECAVCRRRVDEMTHGPYVDHDHDTGKVRGLLCPDCNSLLGFSRDNPSTLRQAAQYLEVNEDDRVRGPDFTR